MRESGVRVAVRDVLALFEKSKIRRVDIREANPEFLRVLNGHIAHNVQSQLVSLNLQEKVDVPGVILSERYRDAFYKDGLGEDTNRWLRYPSNFWAKGTRMLADNLSPARIQFDPDALSVPRKEAIQKIILYSSVSHALERMTNAYLVDESGYDPGETNVHTMIDLGDNSALNQEGTVMEDFNRQQIEAVLSGVDLDPASDSEDVEMVVVEGKVVAPEKSPKEAKETNNQTLLLLAGAAAVLAVTFR